MLQSERAEAKRIGQLLPGAPKPLYSNVMGDVSSPIVCLTIADAGLAARWGAALTENGCQLAVFAGCAEIDVLVLDVLPGIADDQGAKVKGISEPGTVLVTDAVEPLASRPNVDALLPVAVGERELVQTVRLVAEIAKLRRQFRQTIRARQDLVRLAMTDPLTGLANRRDWDEELASRATARLVHSQPLCVAVLDLDQFKQVNDQFGFAAGDSVLRAAATALATLLRTGDFVARVGGDEFGLLLSGVNASQAETACERVRLALAERLAAVSPVPITASIGLVALAERDQFTVLKEVSCVELFARADAALRTAKRSGRNQTVRVVAES